MPGFMLVAGYFAARKIGSIRAARERILRSARHYALPFLSWFLLIDVLLLGKANRNPLAGIGQLFRHIDGGLWFLWVVFVLSIVGTLANFALSAEKRRIIKTGTILTICLGLLVGMGLVCGINFLGIKYILYYSIFYGFGWLVKWSESWWKHWWPKVKDITLFLCLVIFLAIVFNYDLYHTGDDLVSISLRCIAGFAGNAILLGICRKYAEVLNKLRIDKIGRLTLEIYATHVCTINLMEMEESFFTSAGFGNFICSLILTVMFTVMIIATFKTIPAADLIFYGKRNYQIGSMNDLQ